MGQRNPKHAVDRHACMLICIFLNLPQHIGICETAISTGVTQPFNLYLLSLVGIFTIKGRKHEKRVRGLLTVS